MDLSQVKNLPNLKLAAQLMEQAIKDSALGTVFNYSELSLMAGVDDIRTPANRSALETAKRSLLKHHGILLSNLRGVGYRVCEPGQFQVEAKGYMVKGHKAIKKGAQIMKVADFGAMTEDERKEAVKMAGKLEVYLVVGNILKKDRSSKAIDYSRPPSEESVLRFLLDKTQTQTKATK